MACAVLVTVLAVGVSEGWLPLLRLDHWVGAPAEDLARSRPGLVQVLLLVENLFGTVGTIAYTAVLVAVAGFTHRPRVVAWALAVVIGASLTTTALKLAVHRPRPVWDHPVQTLSSFSFPSGHSSGIVAGMGVVFVVLSVTASPGLPRRSLIGLCATLVLVVGADRVLLGVHNVSDVIGGYAVAGFWLALMTVVYSPAATARAHRDAQSLPPGAVDRSPA